jgi:hypothetical protein
MTTFDKRSAGTTYYDRDSQPDRVSHHERDSHHERHAGLPTAASVMCMWTVASYDYALQVLKAQQQFFHSMVAAAAPMLDVARDLASPDVEEGRSANRRPDARSDQRHDDSHRSRKNERYNNDDDTAEYSNRFVAHNRSDGSTSDTDRAERVSTQAEESATTRGCGAASTSERKLP